MRIFLITFASLGIIILYLLSTLTALTPSASFTLNQTNVSLPLFIISLLAYAMPIGAILWLAVKEIRKNMRKTWFH